MSPGSGPATFRPLDYPPSSGKEYAGKPREVVSSAQSPSEMSRNRATHVWLRTQIPGSGQEFALGKLLLNLVPQVPCLLDRGRAQPGGWLRPGCSAKASSPGVRPGWEGSSLTCRRPDTGQDPSGQAGLCCFRVPVGKDGFPQSCLGKDSTFLQPGSDGAGSTKNPGGSSSPLQALPGSEEGSVCNGISS